MADTNENERMATDAEQECEARDDEGFVCTRVKGHGGYHVAHTFRDLVASRWEADRKAADYDRLAGEVERLTRERDEAQAQTAMLRETLQAFWRFAGVADAAEGEPWKVNETNGRLWQMRRDLTATEARAEALETALRGLLYAAEHYTTSGGRHGYGYEQYEASDCPVCAAEKALES